MNAWGECGHCIFYTIFSFVVHSMHVYVYDNV